jgi:hypothetical protein
MLEGGRGRPSGWALVGVLSVIAAARVTSAVPPPGNGAGGTGGAARAAARPRVAIAKATSAFDLPLARVRFAWPSALAQRNDLYAVHGTAGGARAWAVGAIGTIVALRGTEARLEESGTELDLYGVWAAAADDVWAVGERGAILHRDGRGWKRVTSGIKTALYAIWGRNAGEIWVGGEDGQILRGDGERFQPSPTGSKGAIVSIAPCGSGPEICALDRAGLLPQIDVSNRPCPDGDCPIDEPQEPEGDRVLRLANGRWSSYSYSDGEPGRIAGAGSTLWLADGPILRVVREGREVRVVPAQAEPDLVRLRGLWPDGDRRGWLVGERCRHERTPYGDYNCERGAIWRVDGKQAALRAEVPRAALNGVWGWSGGAIAVGGRGNIMRFDGTAWTTLSHALTDADLRGVWVEQPATPAPQQGAARAPIAVRINGKGTGAENVDLVIGDASREIWGTPRRAELPAGRIGRAWLFGDCEALAATDGGGWERYHARACNPGSARQLTQLGATDVWVTPPLEPDSSNPWVGPNRWDGKTWTTVRGFGHPGSAIWGARSDDVWIAAGQNLFHWDGRAVSRAPVPPEIEPADYNDWFTSVWGAAANDVWAAAFWGGGVKLLRFDGTSWRFETAFKLDVPRRLLPDDWIVGTHWSMSKAESHTVALWGTSATDVWLAGPNGIVLRFDGARWSRVRTPTRAGLLAIGGASGRVIAAGMAGVILTATP